MAFGFVKEKNELQARDWLHPKYWGMWCFFAFLRIVILLPLKWIENIGSFFGLLLYRLAPSRRRVTRINIQQAYPDYTEKEIKKLMKACYTPNPDIEAKTFYSDEAKATVLLLEGLAEIPAQQEIRGLQLIAYAPSRKTAAVTLSSADARTQLVLIQDRQDGAAIREIDPGVRRSF